MLYKDTLRSWAAICYWHHLNICQQKVRLSFIRSFTVLPSTRSWAFVCIDENELLITQIFICTLKMCILVYALPTLEMYLHIYKILPAAKLGKLRHFSEPSQKKKKKKYIVIMIFNFNTENENAPRLFSRRQQKTCHNGDADWLFWFFLKMRSITRDAC